MADNSAVSPAFRDRLNLRQGALTALAAVLAYLAALWLRLPGGYWAAISAIVVMQSEVGATVTACRERLAGTVIGSLVGWLTALIWHDSIAVFGVAVLVVMVICAALNLPNAGRLGGVTVAIIVLIPHTGPVWHIAVARCVEVSLGIGVSLAVELVWARIWACKRYS